MTTDKTILDTIVAKKFEEVAARNAAVPEAQLLERISDASRVVVLLLHCRLGPLLASLQLSPRSRKHHRQKALSGKSSIRR